MFHKIVPSFHHSIPINRNAFMDKFTNLHTCVDVFYISAASQQGLPLPWVDLLFIAAGAPARFISHLGLLKAKEIKAQINTCAS